MRQGHANALRIHRSNFAYLSRLTRFAAVAALAAAAGCNWRGIELEERDLVSPNGAITQAGDEARTGWYPDQPGLDPAIVGGASFGRLFKTALTLTPGEQVLAQPLVYNGKVFVATEANNLYLLDAVTGAITNSRALGAAFDATHLPNGMSCGDIQPTVGVTGTPVIDTSTGTAYFFSKSSAGTWTLHAVDATNLAERAGFPVTIAGTAQNESTQTFNGPYEHQRPGLLFMNGVVYGGFGAHCDIGPYQGWIVGVSTSGQIKALFSTEKGTGAAGRGAGVWMSGGGLASDGAGQILFSTGNGYNTNVYPNPIPSNTDPGPLDESIARLTVQGDGTLKTTDFFAPFNAGTLGDSDLGSGGVVALPSQFGTASIPHLAMVSGKEGYFYLLNRDHLGGYKQGAAGGDAYLSRVSLGGSTWQRPAAWPGDGGFMYVMVNGGGAGPNTFCLEAIEYGTDGGGNPTATYVAKSAENFGSYSGSPIVTSNGTASGSALVWAVSNASELRAYDAVPLNGALTLRFHDAYGNEAKFTTVGVGAGRVYVGSGDGNVIGYGSTSLPPVSGGPVDFGTVVVGQSSTINVTLTANQNMTVQSFSTTNAGYTTGAPTPALPNAMTSGQTMTVPVTFTPTASGNVSANLTVATSAGNALVTLTGVGQVNGPQLTATPTTLNFGGVATGTSKQLSVVLQNAGNQTLTFGASTLPSAPFSATGVPASGTTLGAGTSVTASVTFSPTTDGTWSGSLVVASNSLGGNLTINLAATSGAPPNLLITPLAVNYGSVATGTASVMTFVLKNTGGTDLTITKSKPPALGQFTATTTLAEGSVLTAGASVTESVTFSSSSAGSFSDVWVITGNDSNGTQNVTFNATAVSALPRTGWMPTGSPTGGDVATNALDGNIATRWSTGAAQAPGQYFQVDMGGTNTFGIVTMDSGGSAGDYAHGYQVFVSQDGQGWGSAVATGAGTGQVVTATFTPIAARWVRVVQTSTTATNWWSIHEFNVYGTTGGTPPQPPAAPTNLTAGGPTSSTLNLAWTASTTSGVTYSVFRSTTSGFAPGAGNQVASGLAGTSYTDTNLAASTTYYYLVEASGSGGTSGPSNQASATTQASQTLTPLSRTGWVATAQPASGTDTPPKAIDGVANTRFSTGTAQVNGQWFQVDMQTAQSFSRVVMDSTGSNNDYAHTYQVFVSNDGASWGTAIASGTGATVTTVDFAAQTARFIRVVQTSNTPANWWSIHEFNVYGGGALAPNPPTGLTATAASASAINLSWTASTSSGVTYTVFRSTTTGFAASSANQIATGISAMTYADAGLTASTTYYYLVQANGAGGASASSNQASATTQAAPPPNQPTGLTATAASSSAISLSWTASTTTGVTYTVFRSTTSGFTASSANQIATGISGTTYADTGLAGSTTYYYLAQANGAGGASASSNQASATTPAGSDSGGPQLLSRANWMATASVTGGTDVAANAIDASTTTRWSTGVAEANGQSFQVDMQTAQTFDQLVILSNGDYARGYQVFVSDDGASWGTAVASGAGTSATTSISFALQTKRFVRVTSTAAAGNWWSIYDFNVWNNHGNPPPVAYARATWQPAASPAGNGAQYLIDATAGTRWSSGVGQAPGQYFTIDMGVAQAFVEITMDSTGSDTDYAHGYQVFVSNDGTSWGTAVASGTPTGPFVIVSLSATQTARFVKVVQTSTTPASWWSIYEVNVLHF
jgi:fibronectin type 3 domain-containing protein